VFMRSGKGTIVLMGSGELTATMVEVHKDMLARLGPAAQAVFLDTPAGFQLNADQISAGAITYFRQKVGHPMTVASFKSKEGLTPFESEKTFLTLKQADFLLVGPGSPTYALRQWEGSPVPDIIVRRIEEGACFVAASAAALTAGRFTLPVYEIYKVGESPRWVDGTNVLGRFGLNLAVMPHWNNAEGGTHDTRFCFMGESRFRVLEDQLPEEVHILGIDEHTACIIDLARGEARIRGVGGVTLRRAGDDLRLRKNECVSLDILRGRGPAANLKKGPSEIKETPALPSDRAGAFWEDVHVLERDFHAGLDSRNAERMTTALLDLDSVIWKASHDLESGETVSQAREILREWIVLLGTRLAEVPRDPKECLAPVVQEMIDLRSRFRSNRQWAEADAIRESLHRANVRVEDSQDGAHWRLEKPGAKPSPTSGREGAA
jgi:hypothetical protein